MDAHELSKLSDEELESRIADARPNSYVPSSIYHVYLAEQEKRRHNNLLNTIVRRQQEIKNSGVKKRIPSKVVKRLFAVSGEFCAFPNCTVKLISDEGVVLADIAHIEAEKPGGPRFNTSQTDEERFMFENLILFCPTHHSLVDKDSKTYSVNVLRQFKDKVKSKKEATVNVSYIVQSRTQSKHEYRLEITIYNKSDKSIDKPKLKITMPEGVIGVVSSRGEKSTKGNISEIYFNKLDVEVIHPGEEIKIMETPNIGVIYFMNSELFDSAEIMSGSLKIELFADNIKPIIYEMNFRDLQQF